MRLLSTRMRRFGSLQRRSRRSVSPSTRNRRYPDHFKAKTSKAILPRQPRTARTSPETENSMALNVDIRDLLLELFDSEMRTHWGWEQRFKPGWQTYPGPFRDVSRVSRAHGDQL